MTQRHLHLWFASVAGLVAVTCAATSYSRQDVARAPSRTDPQPYGLMPAPGGMYSPATSCAAASCHNAGQLGQEGSEYTTYTQSDPHKKAFGVLYNDDSTRIMANLSQGEPGKWGTKAYKEALCLKCHAVDGEKYFHGGKLSDRNLSEGVSCEACHGPSKDWLSAHYQPGWKALSDREKYEQYKFVQTKDLVSRTLVCAGCHVGQSDREVNHDLIAAGHPRLSFEYTRYHFQPEYRKHWVEKLDPQSFEMKAWLIGQVASLRQAIDLLETRAQHAISHTAPWPELSEASCYACHQGIGSTTSRSSGGDRRGRKPGIPGWQVWYSALTDLLPAASTSITPEVYMAPLSNLGALRKEMESGHSDPGRVVKLAAATKAELDIWLKGVQESNPSSSIPANSASKLAQSILANVFTQDHSQLRDYDWDFLAQHALALTAVYHATGGASGTFRSWKGPLSELRSVLAFKATAARRFDSPKDFEPRAAYAHFKAIHDLTPSGKGER